MVCGDLDHDLLSFVAVIIQTYTASVDEFVDIPDGPGVVCDTRRPRKFFAGCHPKSSASDAARRFLAVALV